MTLLIHTKCDRNTQIKFNGFSHHIYDFNPKYDRNWDKFEKMRLFSVYCDGDEISAY